MGFGPSTHVVLWDTLLDGRFSRRRDQRRDRPRARPRPQPAHPQGDRLVARSSRCRRSTCSSSRRGDAAGSSDPANVPLALLVLTFARLLVARAARERGLAPLRGRGRLARAERRRATRPPQARSSSSFARTSLEQPESAAPCLPLAREPPDADAAHRDGAAVAGAAEVRASQLRSSVSGRSWMPLTVVYFE